VFHAPPAWTLSVPMPSPTRYATGPGGSASALRIGASGDGKVLVLSESADPKDPLKAWAGTQVFALDLATGRRLWGRDCDRGWTAADSKRVYLNSDSNHDLIALDWRTGE
jgi:hypothetical protein